MNYNLEKEMIPVIEKYVVNKFKCEAIAEELPVNHRIVDIVLAKVSYPEENRLQAYKTSFNKLTMAELDVLADIYIKKQVSIHYLIKKLRMDSNSIKEKYLNKFLENNLISRFSKYRYRTTEWAEIKVENMIAIEAKLSDWKTVLNQAIDNFAFADYSYVAIDETICSEKIISQFVGRNIGILSVGKENMVKLVYKPKINKNTIPGDFALQRILVCRDLICNKSKWKLV
ncbi:hypothetical protein [Niallia sp. 03133]|uniref:hypothetical protein n=1 Tax=Niallia sp. 03133 TaxID=3458060 RepID=UPI004043B48C